MILSADFGFLSTALKWSCGQVNACYGDNGDLLHSDVLKNISRNLGPTMARYGITPYLSACFGAPQVIPPDSFTRLRPYLAHFFPRFFPLFACFHRLAEAVPASPKPEPRAKRQWQGGPNTVSAD